MESLVIRNFKNLNELSIESLSKVNLITGKNNVGKSTLLEAISIYASNGDIRTLYQILDDRGEITKSLDGIGNKEAMINSFSSFFPDRKIVFDENNKIVIGQAVENLSNDVIDSVSLQFVYYTEDVTKDANGIEQKTKRVIRNSADIANKLDTTDFDSGLEIVASSSKLLPFGERGYRYIPTPSLYKCKYHLIKTNIISRDVNGNLWDAVVMTEKEKFVIQALQIVEPSIEALSFIVEANGGNNERVPVVKLRDSDTRYRLSSMGDGLNRILTIILGLVNCTKGICLIDEFENGLHYTVQNKLWEIIFKLSNDLDIQVFATTHSRDCIQSFTEMLSPENDGRLIRLENRNGKIVEVNYSEEELKIAANQDIEIR